eukprot:1871116-Amphidinium_carterae.1
MQWFTDPGDPPLLTHLFIGACLGQLDTCEGPVYVGSLDVQSRLSAFYQHLPVHLRMYFAFPAPRTRCWKHSSCDSCGGYASQERCHTLRLHPSWGLHVVPCSC